jgi:hypothetical protein
VVRAFEEATLILLDAVLVVAGVGRLQVLQTGSILSIRHASIHLFCNAQMVSRDVNELLCLDKKSRRELCANPLLAEQFSSVPEDCSQKWPS